VNKAISRVRLSPRMLELMHPRASQINGCGVCAVQHPKIARKLGETDDRIFAVAAWRDAPFFTDAERAALALTERWDAARTVPPHGRTSGQGVVSAYRVS
jgi:AhpD family alkylhydroperoxidase